MGERDDGPAEYDALISLGWTPPWEEGYPDSVGTGGRSVTGVRDGPAEYDGFLSLLG